MISKKNFFSVVAFASLCVSLLFVGSQSFTMEKSMEERERLVKLAHQQGGTNIGNYAYGDTWFLVLKDWQEKYANIIDAQYDFFYGNNELVDISYFIKKGDIEGVKMKCKLPGFDVNAKSVLGGDTPVNLAAREENVDIIDLLESFGATFDESVVTRILDERIRILDEKFKKREEEIRIKMKERERLSEEGDKKLVKIFVSYVLNNVEEKVEDEDLCCSICLELIKDNEENVIELKCRGKHKFHENCINDWYNSGGDTCPNCREQVIN